MGWLSLCQFCELRDTSIQMYTELDLKFESTYHSYKISFKIFKTIFHSNLKALRICAGIEFLGIHKNRQYLRRTLDEIWGEDIITANDDNNNDSKAKMNDTCSIKILSKDKEMKPLKYVCKKRLFWSIEYDSFEKSKETVDVISNTVLKTFVNLEEFIVEYHFDLSRFERHKMQNLIDKEIGSSTADSSYIYI